jgi:transcriptional regulator
MDGKTMDAPDLLPGTLDMLVLKTLTLGPNHGYAIAQHIHRVSRDALRIGEGSLYPALQRLLLHEWVEAEWRLSETNRKARYYRITPAGRKRLAAEVKAYEYLTTAIACVLEGA